jgi:hypothetical protein
VNDLLVVETENGSQLSAFGLQLQDLAINGVGALAKFLKEDLIPIMKDFSESTMISKDMIDIYLMPLKVMAFIIEKLGADVIKLFLTFNILNSIFPITAAFTALANKGFIGMGTGATVASVKVGALNLQLSLLHLRLMSLAALGGGLGLALLAIGHYNKTKGSDDGLGVKTYDRVFGTDEVQPYYGVGDLKPNVDLSTGVEDFMSNYGKTIGNDSMGTGVPVMNVQNLNIDPYGGDS